MLKFLGLDKTDFKTACWGFLVIVLGSIVSAVGINAFLVPHKFISGGVAGVAILLSYLTPLSAGTYVFILNIPIFIYGWRNVGRVFIMGSMLGTLAFIGALYATEWMARTGWAPERLLSAIIGGCLSGGGTGLAFRVNSSHGGTDIIAAAIKKRWSFSLGTFAFISNAITAALLGVFYGLHPVLYTLIAYLCGALAMDKAVTGFDTSRAVFIITSEPQKIADMIVKKLNRGVTFLDGEGAYLGRKQRVIYCVVSLSQLARVKYYVRSVDKQAFLTVAEVSEVLGKGFRSVPV